MVNSAAAAGFRLQFAFTESRSKIPGRPVDARLFRPDEPVPEQIRDLYRRFPGVWRLWSEGGRSVACGRKSGPCGHEPWSFRLGAMVNWAAMVIAPTTMVIGEGAALTLVWRSVIGAGFALPRDAGRRPAVPDLRATPPTESTPTREPSGISALRCLAAPRLFLPRDTYLSGTA